MNMKAACAAFSIFGHTIGHALEAETGYRSLLHARLFAWGMIAATHIALTVGRTDSVTAGRIADAVLSLGRLPELKVSARQKFSRVCRPTRRTQGGVVHFVLPREIGKVEIAADVPMTRAGAVEELRRLSAPAGSCANNAEPLTRTGRCS